MAWLKLFHIGTPLGKFGEREVLRPIVWDNWNFWRISIALIAPSLFLPWTVFLYALRFFRFKGRPFQVYCKHHIKIVFKVRLLLPSSQMMDIVFLLPEGQESGQFCVYRSAWPFPPSYPTALSMSYARNHWVQCSDRRWVKHDSGSLCVLISLNKWKVKYLKAGQFWAVPKHQCWLFFWILTKEL